MDIRRTSTRPFEPSLSALECRNSVDGFGLPAGGTVYGIGFDIHWQDGPTRKTTLVPDTGNEFVEYEQSGAFVEDVLFAAQQRLQFYQGVAGGKFACKENAEAISCIAGAILELMARRTKRIDNGTYGTHEVKDGE